MKNRHLPSGLFSLILSFSFLFLSCLSFAGMPAPGPGSPDGSRTNPADRLYKIRCNQVTGLPDYQAMARAEEQVKNMKSGDLAGLGLNWIEMGPGNAAGRTRTVLFDNRDATGLTLYAGGVTGGIWKSTNLGLTWHQMNTSANEVLRVTALVQTSSGVIYAGTGESYCNKGQFPGTGLYRSEDGENFELIPGTSPTPNSTDGDWAYILKMAINSNGRLFAATNTGLKYSDDGNTWKVAKSGYCVDVKVGSDGTVLTAINDTAYIAVNGDLGNFRNMSTGTTTGLPFLNVGWIEFAIAPSDPNIMYACCADAAVSNMLGVWRSEDKGQTWSVVFPYNNTYFPLNKNGCYAMTLAVFPENPNMILLGGQNLWLGTQYLPTGYFDWQMLSEGAASILENFFVPYSHHAYVFRPNDPNQFAIATDNGISIGTNNLGALSFQLGIRNYITGQLNTVTMGVAKSKIMGGGVNIGTQLIGEPPYNNPTDGKQVWNDGGFGNDGGTGGFCEWSLISPNIVIYSQTGLATDPFRRSEDLGNSFSPTFLGSLAFPTYQIPTHLWESFDFVNTLDSVKFIARDSTIHPGTVLTIQSYNAKFPFPYTVTSTIPKGDSIMIPDIVQSRFFILTGSGVSMTKDVLNFGKDPEWFQICNVAGADTITCFAMSEDLNYLWAGTSQGTLYRISNIALAYDSLTANVSSSGCVIVTDKFNDPAMTGRHITSISISPSDGNKLVVTLGNYGNSDYVYYTTNAQAASPTFTSVQGNLPAMPVYASVIEVNDNSRVIIGTDFGVFSTPDITAGSVAWSADYAGIGNTPVTMIKQQVVEGPTYYRMENWGALYLASYGRGMFMDTTYYMPLGIEPAAGPSAMAGTLRVNPNPTHGQVTVSYLLDKNVHPVLYVYDLTGRMVAYRDLGNETAGSYTAQIDLSGLYAGTYVLRLSTGTGNAYGKVVVVH